MSSSRNARTIKNQTREFTKVTEQSGGGTSRPTKLSKENLKTVQQSSNPELSVKEATKEQESALTKKSRNKLKNKKKLVFPKSRTHPLHRANIFSQIFFCWVGELISISGSTPWRQEMHYNLTRNFKVKRHKPKIEISFQTRGRLYGSIMWCYRSKFFEYTFMIIIASILEFSTTIFSANVMNLITQGIADFRDPAVIQSLLINFAMMAILKPAAEIMKAFYDFEISKVTVGVRISLFSILQDKIMKFSVLNSEEFSQGFIANLIQIDSEEVAQIIAQTGVAILRFVNPLIATIYMGFTVGWKMTAISLGIYTGLKIFSLVVLWLRYVISRLYLYAKDARMSTFRNCLENLEYIKINALENFFCLEIFKKREHEIRYLQYTAWVFALNRLLTQISRPLAFFLIFVYFIDQKDENLDYGAFTSFLQLYTKATFQLHNLVYVFVYFFKSWASIGRMNRFLGAEIKKASYVREISQTDDEYYDNVAISIKNGSFRWKYKRDATLNDQHTGRTTEAKSTPQLTDGKTPLNTAGSDSATRNATEASKKAGRFYLLDVDLRIHKGEKIAVIGKSNSGKSSLLYAMIGEMIPLDDKEEEAEDGVRAVVKKAGRFSYLSQQRWLLGDTIRENITLGEEYDEERMERAIEASQLVHDMTSLRKGIETVVADSAETVSGGQKARIGLARCFYQE